ncbi:MAG: hypothetical protein Q8K18_12760 [Burkholderiales bacterium]|nr:hypothetical protein [Burkholderiales bacterium]
MLSSYEKHRVMEVYENEPYFMAALALKGVACLLIIAGIVAIGVGTDPDRWGDAAQRLAPHEERASIVDAREILAERRARFEVAQSELREMGAEALSLGVARAAAPEPDIKDVVLLRHGSD